MSGIEYGTVHKFTTKFGNPVNLSRYNNESYYYTFREDGYIYIDFSKVSRYNPVEREVGVVYLSDTESKIWLKSTIDENSTIFVKANMIAYTYKENEDIDIIFYPLKSEELTENISLVQFNNIFNTDKNQNDKSDEKDKPSINHDFESNANKNKSIIENIISDLIDNKESNEKDKPSINHNFENIVNKKKSLIAKDFIDEHYSYLFK